MKSRKILYSAFGESKYLKDWFKDSRCEVSYKTLNCRTSNHKWNIEKALLKSIHPRNFKRNKNPKWQGYENLSARYFNRIKKNAKSRGHNCNISIKDAWKQFVKQNGKCALTNIELKFDSASSIRDGNASLDRINSSRGYTKNNIQWVLKHINMMKRNLPEHEFIHYCKLVVDNAYYDGD
jgi:hypothetical protein